MTDATWTQTDNEQAFSEGWGIFSSRGSSHGDWTLQRLDEAATFPDDPTAWAFVRDRAREGSAYHRRAVAFLKEVNPPEHARVTYPYPFSQFA